MSCDNAANKVIGAVVSASGAGAATRQHLQAVYDQPPELKPTESKVALQAAAKHLAHELTVAQVTLPAHMNLDNLSSRAVVRWGRLALAMRDHNLSVTPATVATISSVNPTVVLERLGTYIKGLAAGEAPNVVEATRVALGRELKDTTDIQTLQAMLKAKGYPSLATFAKWVREGGSSTPAPAPAPAAPAAPTLPSVSLPALIGSPELEIQPLKMLGDRAQVEIRGPGNTVVAEFDAALLSDPVNLRRQARWALQRETATALYRAAGGALPEVSAYANSVTVTPELVEFLDRLVDDPAEASLSPWTRTALAEYAEQRAENSQWLEYSVARVLANLSGDRHVEAPSILPADFPEPPGAHPTPDGLPAQFRNQDEFTAWMNEYAADMGIIRSHRHDMKRHFEGTDAEELFIFTPQAEDTDKVCAIVRYALVSQMRMPNGEIYGGEAVGPAAPDGSSRLFSLRPDMTKSSSRWPSANWGDAHKLIFEGSPVRKTNKAGPGTAGTRAAEGLNCEFWTTWR